MYTRIHTDKNSTRMRYSDLDIPHIINMIKLEIFEAINNKNLDEIKKLSSSVKEFKHLDLIVDILLYFLNINADINIFECFMNEIDINEELNGEFAWINAIRRSTVDPYKIPIILEYVKNINQAGIQGNTILMLLVSDIIDNEALFVDNIEYYEKYVDKIRILLEHGADPYKTNEKNHTSVDFATESSYSFDILSLLLNNDTNKKISTMTLFRTIICIKQEYKYDVVELLLNHIYDINEPLPRGNSILEYAKRYPENADIVELLEMHGARVFDFIEN